MITHKAQLKNSRGDYSVILLPRESPSKPLEEGKHGSNGVGQLAFFAANAATFPAGNLSIVGSFFH